MMIVHVMARPGFLLCGLPCNYPGTPPGGHTWVGPEVFRHEEGGGGRDPCPECIDVINATGALPWLKEDCKPPIRVPTIPSHFPSGRYVGELVVCTHCGETLWGEDVGGFGSKCGYKAGRFPCGPFAVYTFDHLEDDAGNRIPFGSSDVAGKRIG